VEGVAKFKRFQTESGRRLQVSVVVLLAGLLLVGGIAGSVATASSVRMRNADSSRDALALSSVEIAATLRLAIQREEDLAVTAAGFFLNTPTPSNEDFVSWANELQVMKRYPELLGWGEVVMVTAAQLQAYAAAAATDPAGVVAGGAFELVPPGERDFYCLFLVGQSRSTEVGAPAGFDYCAGTNGTRTLAARDSGRSGYEVVDTGNGTKTLAVQVPIYRGGGTPATVAARREAFAGWVGLGFDPNVLLETALRDRPGTGVALRFDDGLTAATFNRGTPAKGAEGMTVDLRNGWSVETLATVAAGELYTDRSAVLALLGGVATTLVLVALVLALGLGRAVARRLVNEQTDELRHQALHDALTSLPNRVLIMDRIDQLLVRNRRNGTSGAALYIDIDDFKNVNDTLGHEAGDRLLVAVAARLTTALRDADTIGRMGGDEFVVLIDGASLDVAPYFVAQRLLTVMHQPFELAGALTPLAVSVSIGLAIGDRPIGGDLLRDADVALYQAKAAGKNRYEIFVPEMQTEISRRIDLEFELRSALEANQFELYYQPIYCLEDLSLVGVEALLRWHNPIRGLVEPTEFIPLLEQSGQIQDVGRWVLDEACAQMATWHAAGYDLEVSVNVSGRQLDHNDIIEHVSGALRMSGLDPGSLIIEVTETSLMHNAEATAARLRAIKKLGVQIAIDDFGTGYSSLAYLQKFPVDCLKIDRSFTHAITTSPDSKALIRTLVQLGKDLGLKTLAEGVETTDEMDHLRKENVTEAQGFLLSRPLDARALEALILIRPSISGKN
jgi:diguanylate cyclase (GGDEF)-like protein